MSTTLWLTRDKGDGPEGWYELYPKEPELGETGEYYWPTDAGGHRVMAFARDTFEELFPSLTLDPGQKMKVELTETDKGIRLERL